MKKIMKALIFFTSLIIAACSLPSASVTQTETNTLVPVASPTETETPTPVTMPTAPLVSATPEFAPFCDPNAASVLLPTQCQLPVAVDSSSFCTKKTPYNLIFVNKGSTFKSQNDDFKCSAAGVKNGKQMVTCTGPMASNYEVAVCDPACAIPTVQAAITQCPKDFNYNNLQGCCTQELLQVQQNCVVLELKTTTCVINCREFSTTTTCNQNSNACIWDDKNGGVCVLRN